MEGKRIMKRWKEVQYIHDFLSNTKRKGSMENALNRVGSRFLNQNDFVVSVLDEFGIESQPIQIERHLKALYDTFPGSEKDRVDWCAILCTYLCIVFKGTVLINAKKVVNTFCDIYSQDNNDLISIQDVLDILFIGCFTFGDFEQCSEKLLSSIRIMNPTLKLKFDELGETFISRSLINCILDDVPFLLIQFRDGILSKLNEEKRLVLLRRNEDDSISKFELSADRFVLRRAVLMWNNTLYRTFEAWAKYAKEESLCRLFHMRMLYWRAQQIMRFWRYAVIKSNKLKKIFMEMAAKYELNKQHRSFDIWLKYTRILRKIDSACLLQSDTFKTIALGLTMLRIVRFKMKKKSIFYLWREEVQMQARLEWASELSCKNLIRMHFLLWKRQSYQMKLKRKEAEHKRWARTAIQSIKASIDEHELSKQVEMQPVENDIQSKVLTIRKQFNADLDKNILNAQRDARRKRVEEEKKDLICQWIDTWNKIETQRVRQVVKQTQKWLKTKQAQNPIIKYMKRIEVELKTPPPEASSPVSICLSILDGKLAQIGLLTDAFFEDLLEQSKSGLIHKDSFVSYLDKIGVELSITQKREIFDELGIEDRQGKHIKVSALKEKMEKTYKYIGIEGSQYKKYVNPCHDVLVFHDIVNNELVLEHDMRKKKLKRVALDYFLAFDVVKERRIIFQEKKIDLKKRRKNFAASKIQLNWRAKKEVSRTKLRVRLHHN